MSPTDLPTVDPERLPGSSTGRFRRSPQEFAEHVAELRAVRERLAHELDVMEERVASLGRMEAAPQSEPLDPERLAALYDKLRMAAAMLEDAHQVRLALADHPVTAPAPARSRGRARLVAVLAVAGVLVVAGLLAASGLRDSPAPQRAEVASCGQLPADAGASGSVSCTTGATLTIGAGATPIALGGTEARLLGARRTADAAFVDLRLRNATQAPQSATDRIYLSVRGRRVPAAAVAATDLAPGQTRTMSLRFPLDASAAAILDAAGGRADLGIVPFTEPASLTGTPRRLGVLRVDLSR